MQTNGWTPKTIAERWNCSREHVTDLIRSGTLEALDISHAGATRPRYVVTNEALAEFESRRTVCHVPKPTGKRLLAQLRGDVEQFF